MLLRFLAFALALCGASAHALDAAQMRAIAAGDNDARIAALRGQPEGEDGLIVRAVDALFDDKRLSLSLEAELAAAIGREAVFDLIATVGFYSVLGYMLMTYETPIDEAIMTEMSEKPLAATADR